MALLADEAPFLADGTAGFCDDEFNRLAAGGRAESRVSLPGLGAGFGVGFEAVALGRREPFAGDSVRGVLARAPRSSSSALRFGSTEPDVEAEADEVAGFSPVIDASKSPIMMANEPNSAPKV